MIGPKQWDSTRKTQWHCVLTKIGFDKQWNVASDKTLISLSFLPHMFCFMCRICDVCVLCLCAFTAELVMDPCLWIIVFARFVLRFCFSAMLFCLHLYLLSVCSISFWDFIYVMIYFPCWRLSCSSCFSICCFYLVLWSRFVLSSHSLVSACRIPITLPKLKRRLYSVIQIL